MLAHQVGDPPFAPEVLDDLPDGIILLDRARRVTYVNRAATGFLEREQVELLERTGRRALDQGVEVTVEEHVARLDRWFEVRCVPRVDGVTAIVRDVTDAVRARQRAARELDSLRAERARLYAVLEQMPSGCKLVDHTGQVTFVNAQLRRLFGDGADSSGVRYVAYRADGTRLEPGESLLARSVRDGEVIHDELIEFVRDDGVRRTARLRAGPIRCADTGEIQAAIAFVDDVTDEVAACRAEEEANLLAGLTEALAGPLDYRDTLQRIVDLAADRASDIALLDVVGEDGRLVRLAGAARDPAQRDDVAAAMTFPLDIDADLSPARAFREQRIILEQPLTPEGMARVARSEAHREVIVRLGPTSTMFLPLVARGRSYGLLTLISSARNHSPRDIALAEELGRRAALALENAHLYRAARCAASAARAERERLYALLMKVPVALWVARGADCVHEFANEAACRLIDVGDVIGRTLLEIKPDAAPAHLDAYRRALSGEPVVLPSVPLEVAGDGETPGSTRWFDLRFEPMRDAEGAVEGVMGMAYDLTDQVVARREVERLVDELAHEARLRDLFVGVLAHDLRNPLNAIMLSTGVLTTHPELPAGAARTVQRIEASARRMSGLIEQVLDLTRARAGGGIPVARRPGDLAELCRGMIDELAIASSGRLIELVTDTDAVGAWDSDRLGQVVSNLLGNAVAYSPPGSRIDVRLTGDAERVVLTVRNDGPPIPDHLLPTLFDPFRRATAERSGRSGGLGLGLYITDQIIRAHGGTIDVTSTEVGGTSFTVTLPRGHVPPSQPAGTADLIGGTATKRARL